MSTSILTCGYSFHTQPFVNNHKQGLHCYLLRLQTEGSCRALVNGTMRKLEPGDLLMFKPGDPYELRIEPLPGETQQAAIASGDYYVLCRGEWLDTWWARGSKPQLSRIVQEESLLQLWRQIILEKRRLEEESKELLDYLLRSLCLRLERASVETAGSSGKRFAATRMKRYIEEHANQAFTVEDVARHAGLSVSRAVHLFKESFGKAMIQYALDIRLSSAVERIQYSTMSLEQIAESCGFANYSYFHRVFRARFGVPPSVYRSRGNQHEIMQIVHEVQNERS